MDPSGPMPSTPAERSRQHEVVAISVALTVIATVVVGLRLFTRSMIVGHMFPDDWAMVVTMVFAYAFLLELVMTIKTYHAGLSGAQLTLADMTGILKLTVAIIVTYKALLTSIRVSILNFYLRLAVQKKFETMVRWTLGFVILFFAVFASVTIGQCVPLHKLWDFTGAVQGKCINSNVFYHSGTVIQILLDIWILVLPYKIATAINRPWKEKLSLFIIFGLGVVSIAAAIARLAFLHIFTASKDPFADILPIHVWSMVETNLSIICACLPTLKPLFSKSQRNRTRELNGRSSGKRTNDDSENGSYDMSISKQTDVSVTSRSWASTTTASNPPPPAPPKSPRKDQLLHSVAEAYRESLRPPVPPKSAQCDKEFDSSMAAFQAAKNLERQFV